MHAPTGSLDRSLVTRERFSRPAEATETWQ